MDDPIEQKDSNDGAARVVLGADGSVQMAQRLTRQQRRGLMRRETRERVRKHVGVFTRPQRRWLADKISKEVDQAAGAAAAAIKRGDRAEANRQEARLNRAIEALA
jgi:hypothetical protein